MQEDYERELFRRNEKTDAVLFLDYWWKENPSEEKFKKFWDESSDVRKIELIHQMSRDQLDVILLDYRCFLK